MASSADVSGTANGAHPERVVAKVLRRVPKQRGDAVTLVRVSTTWDHERFREYILSAVSATGKPAENTADIARHVDVSRPVVSRWFRGLEQPSMANLRKVAAKLEVPLADLIELAGHGGADVGAAEMTVSDDPSSHPILAELHLMLRPGSPVPPAEQQTIEAMLERIVAPSRHWMRRGNRPA